MDRSACDPGVVSRPCAYPEGSCWCGAAWPCSGVDHTEDEIAGFPVVWQCTPTPPAVRPDGCPGVEPHGACSEEGKRCGYGECCVQQVRCEGGQWKSGAAICPP